MSGKNSVSKKPLRWNRLKLDWMKFQVNPLKLEIKAEI